MAANTDDALRSASVDTQAVSARWTPYHGPRNPMPLSDMIIPDAEANDERVWVPLEEAVWFRPLCLSATAGYWTNLLRVRRSGVLSRHRHPRAVHGYVLRGEWRYLEHDWVARQGSYVFEPPGDIHTLVVDPHVEEMVTLFHVEGGLIYCDPDGVTTGHDDVFSRIERCRHHYASCGLGAEFVEQFIR